MLPRHPLIFKITIICATFLFACFVFYNRESRVIITRNIVVVGTQESATDGFQLENDAVQSLVGEKTNIEADDPIIFTTTTDLPTTINYKFYVDADKFEYSLDQEPCDKSVYLMIYIHTGPENTERRRVIRKTWASPDILKKHKARLVFVMGQVEDENTQAALENENDIFKDIIQGNFTDTYRNLTYKAISGLRWVSENCPNVMYVLKTDDDIVVDIHRVVRLMKSYIEHKWGKENILAGYIWTHMDVDRNKSSKWYTSPEEFPKNFFLKYCSGSAYIMTPDVVTKFYLKSRETPFFWVDDYFVTGLLAHETNVTQMSMNDRYILQNSVDFKAHLANDTKTRFVFVHSPNTSVSTYVWQNFLDRW